MYNSENRIKILTSAESLFRKYGTRSISMDDLAHELNMSKKTIYESFADKNEIVYQVIAAFKKQLEGLVEAIIDKPANPVHQLVRIFICLTSIVRETNPSLIYDLQKYHENVWLILQGFRDDFLVSKVKAVLLDGIRKQYFSPTLDVNFYATFFLAAVQLSGNEKLFPPAKYSQQALTINLLDCLLVGIGTKKGSRAYEKHKLNALQSLD